MIARILLLSIALLFLGAGVFTVFAADAPSSDPSISSPVVATAGVGVFAKTLTQNQHLMILIRMGLFYGGFICVLLAFDFGMNEEESSEGKNSSTV